MKKSTLLCGLCAAPLAAGLFVPVQAEGIYKWTDSQGQVNYADMVPTHIKAQKIDDRILVKSHRDATPDSSGNSDAAMTAGNVFEPNELPATSAGAPE